MESVLTPRITGPGKSDVTSLTCRRPRARTPEPSSPPFRTRGAQWAFTEAGIIGAQLLHERRTYRAFGALTPMAPFFVAAAALERSVTLLTSGVELFRPSG